MHRRKTSSNTEWPIENVPEDIILGEDCDEVTNIFGLSVLVT